MADYEILTPGTLLFRVLDVERASAALALLDSWAPGDATVPEVRWVYTVADVASDPDATPPAACTVAHSAGLVDAWIDRFVVALPFRRRGLGRRLITEAVTALRGEGVQRLFIRTMGDERLFSALLRGSGVTSRTGPCGQWSDTHRRRQDAHSWSWWACGL